MIKRSSKFPQYPGVDKELDSLVKQFNEAINRVANNVNNSGSLVEQGLVGTKQVDETNIGDDKIIVFKSGSDKMEYENKPTGAGTPATTVVTEKAFGQSEAVGTSTNYARQDHTHGTPAAPTKSDVGLGNVTNDAQLKAADLDTDGSLAANSDSKIPSQKAVKTYVDNSGDWIYKFKTATQSKTSDSTLADDPDMYYDIPSTGEYWLELVMLGGANITPDMKVRIEFTGTTSVWSQTGYKKVAASSTISPHSYTAITTETILSGTPGRLSYYTYIQFNATTTGRISFQWAQNTSDAAATTVYAGSYFRIRKAA